MPCNYCTLVNLYVSLACHRHHNKLSFKNSFLDILVLKQGMLSTLGVPKKRRKLNSRIENYWGLGPGQPGGFAVGFSSSLQLCSFWVPVKTGKQGLGPSYWWIAAREQQFQGRTSSGLPQWRCSLFFLIGMFNCYKASKTSMQYRYIFCSILKFILCSWPVRNNYFSCKLFSNNQENE